MADHSPHFWESGYVNAAPAFPKWVLYFLGALLEKWRKHHNFFNMIVISLKPLILRARSARKIKGFKEMTKVLFFGSLKDILIG